jgi:hypothetical protein
MKNKTSKIIETLQKARNKFNLSQTEVDLRGSSISGSKFIWVKFSYKKESYEHAYHREAFYIKLERDKDGGSKSYVGTGTGAATIFTIPDSYSFGDKYVWLIMAGLIWIQDEVFACGLSEDDFVKVNRKYKQHGLYNGVGIPSYRTYEYLKCIHDKEYVTLKEYAEDIWKKVSGLDVEESKNRVRDELPLLVKELTQEEWQTLYDEYIVQEVLTS